MRRLPLLCALALAACTPTHSQTAAAVSAIDARNEAVTFLYRCTNERAFRALHSKRCRAARVLK